MKFELTPNITKEWLLSKINEESIFCYYHNLPNITKKLYRSPLRSDKNPTCAFYKGSNGVLYYKDFASGKNYNCISFVMELYKISYYKALRLIASDFGLIHNEQFKETKKLPIIIDKPFEESKDCVIEVKVQDFTKEDLEYWEQYGITEKTLKKFRVFSCATVWINGYIFTRSDKRHPIFGYYRGKNNKGNELWRIYMPNHRSKEPKFLSNWKASMIQGAKQLPKEGDIIVVTKAMKDVMSLYELGIPAIAPNSENLFLSEAQYNKLKERFKKIVIFYDNDLAGLHNMNKFRKQFSDIIPFWIPLKYHCKDVSDFIKKYGIEEAKKEAIIKLYNKYCE